MIPMNFLGHLTLNLNTWCISVEEEAVDIDLIIMSTLHFKIYRHMIELPYMTLPADLHPSTLVPHPVSNQTPSAVEAQPKTQPRAPRGIGSRWTQPVELLQSPDILLSTCITECLVAREKLPVLDNGSIMQLVWYLCGSCSIDCHKHRYHGANHHLYGTERH